MFLNTSIKGLELFKSLSNLSSAKTIRQERLRSFSKWYKEFWTSKVKSPPYKHVAQIGDPILRNIAKEVSKDKIYSDEIRNVIETLKHVMKKYNSMGLAAPQIGIPLRIFAISFNEKQYEKFSPEIRKARDMSIVPFTVFINPEMKVLNYDKVIFQEACESVRGYCADVPRYKEVIISGFNEFGKRFSMQGQGWIARIMQHEMDHLNGKFYTDIMIKSSLACGCWEAVNKHSGRIEIRFTP